MSELRRISEIVNQPIPEWWDEDGPAIEDADGGIHAQFYRHRTEPLLMVEIFPCPACAAGVRYVFDKKIACDWQRSVGRIFAARPLADSAESGL